jgi:hypothetical protein
VVARVDVAEVPDVRRQRLVVPAAAAEQEARPRADSATARKNSLDARLAVRQAVAEEGERPAKPDRAATGWCVEGSTPL